MSERMCGGLLILNFLRSSVASAKLCALRDLCGELLILVSQCLRASVVGLLFWL
jgi:hypothetical protein